MINHMPCLNSYIYIPSTIFRVSIGSEILYFVRAITNLINMVTHVDLLLIWMKKQSSECTHIFLLLRLIIGKHFKVFHKFADAADKYITLLTWQLFVYNCMCRYIFMRICMYKYMYFMCVIYVCIAIF